MAIEFVKAFIVANMLAFDLASRPEVRQFFAIVLPEFPATSLHIATVKHHLVELYAATKGVIHRLLGAVNPAAGPILHLNFDLWTSKLSHEKCVGIRIFWMTSAFVFRTALLAVKQFRPAPSLTDSSPLSSVFHVWVTEVLEEWGLAEDDVYSSVTDGGSDVERLFPKLATSKWEWCIPHMLNCVLVEVCCRFRMQAIIGRECCCVDCCTYYYASYEYFVYFTKEG